MSESNKGDFYIIEEECITCRAPESVASDLIGFYDDPDPRKSHCYLKKQPSDPCEISLFVKAAQANCCGTYRYRGSDKSIRKQLGRGNVD